MGGCKYRVFCQAANSSDQSAVSTVTQPNLETDEGAGIVGENNQFDGTKGF